MQLPRLIHIQSATLIELPQKFTVIRIGKAHTNWIPDIDVSDFVNSDVVSRSHLEIRIQGNDYFVEDLGSSNGTYLNHSRLAPFTPYKLCCDDRINLGKDELFTFLFREARKPHVSQSNADFSRSNRQASASRSLSNNIPAFNFRANNAGKQQERNQQRESQEESFIFSRLKSLFEKLISLVDSLKFLVSKLIENLISFAVKTGIFLIALFLIALLGVVLSKGLSSSPIVTQPVARGGGTGAGIPLVQVPVQSPVRLPTKPLTEPRRIRVPFTNENRPAGQASCDCPYDRARDNSICGGRSAYVKPGGKEPACYVGETTARERWWNNENNSFVARERKGR